MARRLQSAAATPEQVDRLNQIAASIGIGIRNPVAGVAKLRQRAAIEDPGMAQVWKARTDAFKQSKVCFVLDDDDLSAEHCSSLAKL